MIAGCMFRDLSEEIQEEKITWHLVGRVQGQ
jgi:uncharacterized pyridoxal phosphate-containing UPF0001 family protein